jgi:hypothetical protein
MKVSSSRQLCGSIRQMLFEPLQEISMRLLLYLQGQSSSYQDLIADLRNIKLS